MAPGPTRPDFEKKKSIGRSEACKYDGNHAEPYPRKVKHLTGIQKSLQAIRGFEKSHSIDTSFFGGVGGGGY